MTAILLVGVIVGLVFIERRVARLERTRYGRQPSAPSARRPSWLDRLFLSALAALAIGATPAAAQSPLDSLEQRLVHTGAAAKSTVTQIENFKAHLRQIRARLLAVIPDGWTISAPLIAADGTPDPERRRAVWTIPFDSTATARVLVLDSLGRVLADSAYTGGLPVPASTPDTLSGAQP